VGRLRNDSDVVIRLDRVTVEIPLRGMRSIAPDADPRVRRNARGQIVLAALDDVSLEVRRKDRIGIVGGNGSGKTTLLKLIGGLLPAARGTVEVHGELRVMLSAGSGIYPALTGRRNAHLQYGLLGITKTSLADFLADVEDFAELGGFFDMPVGTYSPGMISRLQFAINTVEPADILLLDEWMGVADQSFHEKAQKRLRAFVFRNDAFLFASHNRALLEAATDSQVSLRLGRLTAPSRSEAAQEHTRSDKPPKTGFPPQETSSDVIARRDTGS
jgi:ABC-type polysaccharide/polyol phosphate transport system ATPase subunit